MSAKADGGFSHILTQAPASPGPDYASWLSMWCRSGARDVASDAPTVVAFKPRAQREPSEYLDDDNMHPMRKLLARHPGAPMAFAEMCRNPSGFQRLRYLIEYMKVQSENPSVTNASDQGSTTAYVSPLHVDEVMRGFQVEDEEAAEQEIARIRQVARDHVLRDLLSIASSACEEAFTAAMGTWIRKEYGRRQSAENVANVATAGAAAVSRGAGKGGTPGQDLPAQARETAPRGAAPASTAPAKRALGFGFARRPGA
ncbi:MAG: hypothetical protein JSS14_22590 [Proteobacteria bacterium]|nr:hypothetical protein [Pseudomonadota bacterium]